MTQEATDSSFPADSSVRTRASMEGSVSCWDMVGSIGRGRVDATAFAHMMNVRAKSIFSCREACDHALPHLVDAGMYLWIPSAARSLHILTKNINADDACTKTIEPS